MNNNELVSVKKNSNEITKKSKNKKNVLANSISTNLMQKYNIGDDNYAQYEDIKNRKSSSNKMFFSIILIGLIIGGCFFGGLYNGLRQFRFHNHYIFVPSHPRTHNKKSFYIGDESFSVTNTKVVSPKMVFSYDMGDANNPGPNNLLDFNYFRGDFSATVILDTEKAATFNVLVPQTKVSNINEIDKIPTQNDPPSIEKINQVVKITDWSGTIPTFDFNLGMFFFQGRLPDNPQSSIHKYLFLFIFSYDNGANLVNQIIPYDTGINMTFWSQE